jgi:hypothetical protein
VICETASGGGNAIDSVNADIDQPAAAAGVAKKSMSAEIGCSSNPLPEERGTNHNPCGR